MNFVALLMRNQAEFQNYLIQTKVRETLQLSLNELYEMDHRPEEPMPFIIEFAGRRGSEQLQELYKQLDELVAVRADLQAQIKARTEE